MKTLFEEIKEYDEHHHYLTPVRQINDMGDVEYECEGCGLVFVEEEI